VEIQCKFGKVFTSIENITNNDLEAISVVITHCISEIKKLLNFHRDIHQFSVIIIDDPLLIPFAKLDTHEIFYPYSSYLRLKNTSKKCCPDLVHELTHFVYFDSSRQLLSEGLAVSCALIICREIFYPYHVVVSPDLKEDSIKLAKKTSPVFWEANESPQAFLFSKETPSQNNESARKFYALGGSFIFYLFSKFPANYILSLLQSNETGLSNLFSDFLSNTHDYLSTSEREALDLESINLLLEPWLLSSSNDNNDENPMKIISNKEKLIVTGNITANEPLNGFAVGVNMSKFGLTQARCKEIHLKLATFLDEMQLFYTTNKDEEPGEDYFYTLHPIKVSEQSQTIKIQDFYHVMGSDQNSSDNDNLMKIIGLRSLFSVSQKINLEILQFDLKYLN